MTEPWTTLILLAVVSAVLPVQVAITILMLRSPGGARKAIGWVSGMMAVRLLQWLVFGVVLGAAVDEGEAGAGTVEATLLLVVAILLLLSAARKLANQPDEDAAPPRWMTVVGDVPPGRAFLMGAAVVGLSPKLWAFTLGVIGAIESADLGGAQANAAYLVFVLLAASIHLAAIVFTVVAPARAEMVLGRVSGGLERHSRVVMIVLSAGFGVWFLLKSLAAFGLV